MPTDINTLNTVTVSVTVANQRVNPVSLILTQEYGEHHHFEITLDYDMYGDDFMSDPIKHIQLIGEQVVMNFSHKNDNSDYYLFTGVVTNVKQTGKDGKKGYLEVSGSSPTIMLEKGRRMDIYSNKTLRGIFEILFEGVHSHYMKYVANPVYKNRVDFLMQYNETDWEFIKRMAYLYKENLFYSGVEILFGTYQEWDPVKLTYDREIIDLEFCSRMQPNNFEYYQYVAERNAIIERQSSHKINNSNDYLDAVEQQNIILTNKKLTKSYIDTPVYESTEISEILKREKSRNAADTIAIKGRSKTYRSTIGRSITINIPNELSKTTNLGTYRVIKSIHRIDENNRYTNEFEAVPASLDTMPVKEPKMPQADSVIGKIRSNEDPLNQGRVQVDFDFARNYNFSWLRVLTPNAGSSAEMPQNRGMVFVPEKGDQVMIGFEYGDPNRPYVMGSLFHGKNGHGGGQNNAEKSIVTRSGIQIVFNDDQRSLHIEDPSGNTWDMDGQGNISVYAPKKMRLESEYMEIMATKDLTIEVAKQMKTSVYGQTLLETPRLEQTVTDYYHTYAGRTLLNSPNEIRMESPETFVVGERKLFFHSEESAVLNSKGTTEIKGAGGTNHTNIAAEHETQKEEIKPKCLVSFRPHSAYDGEFGFDWMRTGDSGLQGDNAFKDIMGKHYEADGVTISGYQGQFRKDPAMSAKALRDYKNMIIGWKPMPYIDDCIYSPPYMTLLEGKTAKLKLILDIEELPTERLTFEFEDKTGHEFYMLSILEIKKELLKREKYAFENCLSITATKECEKQHVLLVKADGEVCGKLFIYANAKAYHKNIQVVFIQVQTNINGREKTGTSIDGGYAFFKDCLNQAFVIPQDTCEMVELDCLSKTDSTGVVTNQFRDMFCSLNSSATFYLDEDKRPYWSWDLKDYLENATVEQYEDRYADYYRVYFMGENLEGYNGYSYLNTQFGVYFDGHEKATIAHELFHAMGLPHTFDGVSASAIYTYEGIKTDNILDYSHHANIPRRSLFAWQWKALNPKIGQTKQVSIFPITNSTFPNVLPFENENNEQTKI